MSSFNCPKCGQACVDTEGGYVTGCEHYPPDAIDLGPQRGPASVGQLLAAMRSVAAEMPLRRGFPSHHTESEK
jgi:hypothetical protein